MTNGHQQGPSEFAGLAKGFEAWWAPTVDSAQAIRRGLIVLDANVLLHLYRVTPAATLFEVRERLWIPHQAALEFHRNRTDVVLARMRQFREVRQILREAPRRAIAELRKAVARFRVLQQASMTSREWNPDENGLDENSVLARLDGVMDELLAELAEIEAEHDLGPQDLQAGDAILLRLESITAGRIGPAYDDGRIRQLVDEATVYRFPNEIPPGYKDAITKVNAYRAAGDYILWRQVMEYAATTARNQHLLLVTNDVKEDWWLLDNKGRPVRGRPELRQELFECSGALMIQMTLSNFLDEAAEHFPNHVSADTVNQIRGFELTSHLAEALSVPLDGNLDLMSLSPIELEHLTRQLLETMGYNALVTTTNYDHGFDIDATRPIESNDQERTLIVVKRYRGPVMSEAVRALYGAVIHEQADRGMVITTSRFANSAKRFAENKNISLVEGSELLRLIHEYLGVAATISDGRSRDNEVP